MKRTRAEIIELQKQDTYTITLTKEQARIIGDALGTEIDDNDKCIKDMQDDLKNIENGEIQATKEEIDLIESTIKFLFENNIELTKMRDNLKDFYGWLVD